MTCSRLFLSPRAQGYCTFGGKYNNVFSLCDSLAYICDSSLRFVDGGKGHGSVEKNGDKCGRGREEDGEEHG